MRTRVNFEVNPVEFEVLKNALFNYRGKLLHQKNNYEHLTYEDCKRIETELKVVNTMINEFSHSDEVR